jgi:hypothetical protein
MEMGLGKLLDRFVEERPVAVMYRALLERVLSAERVNGLFADAAQQQYEHRIAFSTVVDILGEVVARQQKAVHTAYQAYGGKPTVGASVAALYDKLSKVEPVVSERLVAETAADLADIVDGLPRRKPLLPGFPLRILDGKQLGGTDHRLAETRQRREAVLPGKLCPVLDPDRELVLGVAVTEDAHANERTLWDGVLQYLREGDCVMGDRNFCTKGSVLRLDARNMKFILRQHMGDCPVEELSRPRRLGRTASGTVYEQSVRIVTADGQTLTLRRVTLRLSKPTDSGDKEIHLLTNLPAKIGGRKIAELYRHRWRIEQAFQSLAEALRGEVNTLAYPRAALLGYCLALVAHNLLSTVKAAVHHAHSKSADTKLSSYYLADEVSRAWDGMDLMIPAAIWERQFVNVTLPEFVRKLRRIAKHACPSRFATKHRGPKKPRRQLPRGKSTHLSTFRLLTASRTRNC